MRPVIKRRSPDILGLSREIFLQQKRRERDCRSRRTTFQFSNITALPLIKFNNIGDLIVN